MRLRRAPFVVIAAVLGLWALYAIAGNVLLRTTLLRDWLDSNEDKLKVEYDSAWTWLPGRVHVRGLSLRFQDSNVQMLLELERANIYVDPFALARRTFHATHVDADGARLLFRHKLTHLEGNEGRVAAYPRIPGFADPPLKSAAPSKPSAAPAWR